VQQEQRRAGKQDHCACDCGRAPFDAAPKEHTRRDDKSAHAKEQQRRPMDRQLELR
jgi:hypothetical protein